MSDANGEGALAPEDPAALKAERRKRLKRLQMICHMRGDEELPQVVEELLEEIGSMPNPNVREETRGRDRKERGGRNRSE